MKIGLSETIYPTPLSHPPSEMRHECVSFCADFCAKPRHDARSHFSYVIDYRIPGTVA